MKFDIDSIARMVNPVAKMLYDYKVLHIGIIILALLAFWLIIKG